jgi:hypothetical protein
MHDEKLRALRRAIAKPFGKGALKKWVIKSADRLNVVPYDSANRPRLEPELRSSEISSRISHSQSA